jgi:pseudouridine-5'-phosphate glycosidase
VNKFIISPEVADALSSRKGVVALESTIITHGLPRPRNLKVALEIEESVRKKGAIPATIAMLDGDIHVGLSRDALVQVATREDSVKASVRDLAILGSKGAYAGTTVAATSHIATSAGIRVFATGVGMNLRISTRWPDCRSRSSAQESNQSLMFQRPWKDWKR